MVRHALGAGYAALVAGYFLYTYSSPFAFTVGTAAAAAAGGLVCYFVAARWTFRVIASIQAVVLIMAYRVYLHSLPGNDLALQAPEILTYILFGIGMPLVVAVFICQEPRIESTEDELPPGYEHLKRHSRPLPDWAKLLLILGVCAGMLLQMFSGLLFVMIFLLPAGIIIGWAISIFRKHQHAAPLVQRRIKLKPQLELPAQQRSQYTVDSSEYNDPDQYRHNS